MLFKHVLFFVSIIHGGGGVKIEKTIKKKSQFSPSFGKKVSRRGKKKTPAWRQTRY